MSNVVIIGSGPAGISAALYTLRAGFDTTIISKGSGALEKAEMIENYYGFPEGISGKELEKAGIEGALRLGAKLVNDEAVGFAFYDKLTVKTVLSEYKADAILIATGSSRSTPKIKGLSDFEGKGVSYCAVCDAFFYRQKNVCVLGSGEYALHEANEISAVAKSVTILTNGSEPTANFPENMIINKKEVAQIEGTERVEKIKFKDGTEICTEGIFVAVGVAGSSALAKKIGALTEGNNIVIDENMATNIPGLYAAGDCTGGFLQIAKAVYEGAKAGTEIIKYLRSLN